MSKYDLLEDNRKKRSKLSISILMSATKTKKRHYDELKTFIKKVLKKVHPDSGINSDALGTMEALMSDSLSQIMRAVNELTRVAGTKTVDARVVEVASDAVLPGDLAKHARSEGKKAVKKYLTSEETGSRAAKAGLDFPPTRIGKMMRALTTGCGRQGDSAPVFMAAVLEYLCAEVLELAGRAARDTKHVRITPRDISLAIMGDEELVRLYKDVVLPGGVIPHIESALLIKRAQKKRTPKKRTPKKKVVKKKVVKRKSATKKPAKKKSATKKKVVRRKK